MIKLTLKIPPFPPLPHADITSSNHRSSPPHEPSPRSRDVSPNPGSYAFTDTAAIGTQQPSRYAPNTSSNHEASQSTNNMCLWSPNSSNNQQTNSSAIQQFMVSNLSSLTTTYRLTEWQVSACLQPLPTDHPIPPSNPPSRLLRLQLILTDNSMDTD